MEIGKLYKIRNIDFRDTIAYSLASFTTLDNVKTFGDIRIKNNEIILLLSHNEKPYNANLKSVLNIIYKDKIYVIQILQEETIILQPIKEEL